MKGAQQNGGTVSEGFLLLLSQTENLWGRSTFIYAIQGKLENLKGEKERK